MVWLKDFGHYLKEREYYKDVVMTNFHITAVLDDNPGKSNCQVGAVVELEFEKYLASLIVDQSASKTFEFIQNAKSPIVFNGRIRKKDKPFIDQNGCPVFPLYGKLSTLDLTE